MGSGMLTAARPHAFVPTHDRDGSHSTSLAWGRASRLRAQPAAGAAARAV